MSRLRLANLFGFAIVALGCMGGPGKDKDEAGTEGDADADADADADGDADTDADDPPPCPDWTGYADGAWYELVLTEEGREITGADGGYRLDVEQEGSGDVTLTVTQWSGTPEDEIGWGVGEGFCDDDGWWVVSETTEYDIGTQDLAYSTSEYSDPCLSWPHDVELGSRWTLDCERTLYTHDSPEGSEMPVRTSYVAAEEVVVDTPAGRLDALGIGWDGVDVGFYRHRDLGFIADATFYEIADWGE